MFMQNNPKKPDKADLKLDGWQNMSHAHIEIKAPTLIQVIADYVQYSGCELISLTYVKSDKDVEVSLHIKEGER